MPFGTLWLPVVVSTVAVFFASFLVHMVLKYHKADVKQLPNEEAVRDALGKGSLAPGQYMTPYCVDNKQMKEPAMQEKFKKGPVAIVTVFPNGSDMAKHMALWVGFCLLASFTAAYIARHTLSVAAAPRQILQITGAVAFVAYGYGNFVDTIWRGQPWGTTIRALIDSLIYAIVTAMIFCWLWPKG
ncbi:MAG TPA: hypothetical protein VFV19_08915 [Candidatus Polarisedimenticolaceae bacterium]|nr:hypothetical protein [Candidatus Polarisedimenticolaceae bacterium]